MIYLRALSDLDIHQGEQELCLPVKEELDDVSIVRRAERTVTGYTSHERISGGMMPSWVKRFGEVLGFEYTTICYYL